jgi:serine/threonine protein kinase
MSPEVIKGEKYGEKADIWAIGCALYEMVMLRKPFNVESDEQVTSLFEKI